MGATDRAPDGAEKKDVDIKGQETATKPAEVTEDVPDPDEDDLDDLDGEYSTV